MGSTLIKWNQAAGSKYPKGDTAAFKLIKNPGPHSVWKALGIPENARKIVWGLDYYKLEQRVVLDSLNDLFQFYDYLLKIPNIPMDPRYI